MAFRYRLCPDDSQSAGCERHCADARFVWNLALEQANCWRPGRGPTPGNAERHRQLAEARASSWLGTGSSSVQQQALRDFDQALRNWWAATHRRPRWRKAGVDEGFCLRDVRVRRISRKWAEVHVPKVGWVRFRVTRPLGQHGMARVTRDRARHWHVSFAAPQPPIVRTATGAVVGIDLGVTHAATTSTGDHFDIPGLRPSEQCRLLRLERKKARQHKGSKRYVRTKHAIAVLHARATNRRQDWVEKTSTRLVVGHDLVVFEDLKVKEMLRSARGSIESPGRNVAAKAGLNRRIAASSWSRLVRRTTEKAAASLGCAVVRVDPRHTSQRCSACGHLDPGNRRSQAVFSCLDCGHAENADVNAAKNILAAGLAVTARGGKSAVRTPSEARTPQKGGSVNAPPREIPVRQRRAEVKLGDMSLWPVEPIDPVTASDGDLAGLHNLEVALELEALPGEPVAPLAHSVAEYRHERPFVVRKAWVVRQGLGASPASPNANSAAGEIVAWGYASYVDVPENRNHAHVWVAVHPEVRGLGLGSTLMARVVETARRWGCTVLDFEARVGGPGEPFLRSIGAERRLIERRSRCRTADIDRELLEGWARRAGERAAGYSLVAWDGRCPDELLDAWVALKGVMNTAPLEAFEWDDECLTAERWRAIEATSAARGFDTWQVCARHDDSGELAGYTELTLPKLWPQASWQEDTGVWPKHRERGLGRWLKAVNALRLLDERPEVEFIDTWNAGSNEAMLAINVAMGFQPLENWGDWQAAPDAVAEALRRRRAEAS